MFCINKLFSRSTSPKKRSSPERREGKKAHKRKSFTREGDSTDFDMTSFMSRHFFVGIIKTVCLVSHHSHAHTIVLERHNGDTQQREISSSGFITPFVREKNHTKHGKAEWKIVRLTDDTQMNEMAHVRRRWYLTLVDARVPVLWILDLEYPVLRMRMVNGFESLVRRVPTQRQDAEERESNKSLRPWKWVSSLIDSAYVYLPTVNKWMSLCLTHDTWSSIYSDEGGGKEIQLTFMLSN